MVPIPCGLQPDLLNVYADGKYVPRDTAHVSGWDFTDGTETSIQLYGDPCVNLQNDAIATLAFTQRCLIP